jgi:hypothetical protein
MMTATNDMGSPEQALKEMFDELLRQPAPGSAGHAPVTDEQFERLLGLLHQAGMPTAPKRP